VCLHFINEGEFDTSFSASLMLEYLVNLQLLHFEYRCNLYSIVVMSHLAVPCEVAQEIS